ncbi:hypothetical protein IVZ55_27975 [Salmonella enterica subsp. enterica serovar Worthington]|nr:hypothetical protein [Salmonella enterica subsp. enterica serovar Worthington]
MVMAGDGDESKVDVTDIRFATALSFGIGACISCQQLRQAEKTLQLYRQSP